ncbi:MAG: hypothetical protein ACE5FG_11115 [Myxococcota bacterium]
MHRTRDMIRWSVTGLLGVGLTLAAQVPSVAARSVERSKAKLTLQNTGVRPAAESRIRTDLRPFKSKLDLRAKRLAPSTTYSVRVDGIEVGSLTTGSSGAGKLRFRTPVRSSKDVLLDFDPRGKLISISDGVADVLSTILGGPGEPADAKVDERTVLAATALASGATIDARFRSRSGGRRSFRVEVEGMPQDGDYELRVDGLVVATIPVVGGRGEVKFDTQPQAGKLPLDFDPRGATIDITQGLDVFASDVLAAEASGVNVCASSENDVFLTPTAAAGAGQAKARLRIRDDCDEDLRIEVEDLAAGDYAVCVSGVFRGAFTAADNGLQIFGEIEFDSDPSTDERLLDFAVDLAQIEIRADDGLAQAGDPCPTTALIFDVASGSPPPPGSCTFSETNIALAAAMDAPPGGAADVRFRTRTDCDEDLRIEIQDVPGGDYAVCVGGLFRATLTAASSGGQVQGQIEFDTSPSAGEILLNFTVDLGTIEIRANAPAAVPGDPCPSTTLLFAGGGAGGPPPATCEFLDTEVPLLNVGPDSDAKGKARLRMDTDCDRDFRVEIENLPAGDYDLRVGGILRGTLAVAFDASTGEIQGEIEFDNDPDQPAEVPFPADMDPRGQDVEIVQGTTVFLARGFPSE